MGGGGDSFVAKVGIRQGCPLSPLVFAVVADILLRKLVRHLDGAGELRAFADDTALVLRDTLQLSSVLEIFDQYAEFSNLRLNLGKTVVIPLYLPGNLEAAKFQTYSHCFQDGHDVGQGLRSVPRGAHWARRGTQRVASSS